MSRWVKVARIDDIGNEGLAVSVGEEPVLLVRKGGEVFAISNVCSHQEMELRGGETEGEAWICPHHGARFGLRDGAALSMPAVDDIKVFRVKLENGDVLVEEEQ